MVSPEEGDGVLAPSPHRSTVASEQVTRNFPRLLERLPAVIYIADLGIEGSWHYVSPQVEATLGFSPEEWLADPGLWRSRIHPEDRDRVLSEESDQAEEGMDGPPTEYRMFHRDGSIVWLSDQAMLVRDRDGKMRWHGVMSDITERKQAEA